MPLSGNNLTLAAVQLTGCYARHPGHSPSHLPSDCIARWQLLVPCCLTEAKCKAQNAPSHSLSLTITCYKHGSWLI